MLQKLTLVFVRGGFVIHYSILLNMEDVVSATSAKRLLVNPAPFRNAIIF
ncbi:hypothetical protein IIE_05188 [Bacillus cereus VD045]|nr:hypothetical protein BG03_5593 [Bacillus cereus]EJR28940.1 hypothetical protein IIE_05188 [Bacillus cereus VD045]EJR83457.1 hypothetical protein IKA_05221 [Bacillus cereus VD169]